VKDITPEGGRTTANPRQLDIGAIDDQLRGNHEKERDQRPDDVADERREAFYRNIGDGEADLGYSTGGSLFCRGTRRPMTAGRPNGARVGN
jgi:hypothetical protein